MLMEGVRLMLIGMGTVFALLTVLILLMQVTASVVARLDLPQEDAEDAGEAGARIAAVLAAVEKIRRGTA